MEKYMTKVLYILDIKFKNIKIYSKAAKAYVYSIKANWNKYNEYIQKTNYCVTNGTKALNDIELIYTRIINYYSKYSLDERINYIMELFNVAKTYVIEMELAYNDLINH